VNQRREFLGGLHSQKQSDFASVRESFCRGNTFGVIHFDAASLDELKEALTVTTDIALHIGERRKLFPFRLAYLVICGRASARSM
jgi:hypothetical protein